MPVPVWSTDVLRRDRGHRAGVYARLGKLAIFDYYLSPLLVWSMLPPEDRLAPATVLFLALYLPSLAALFAAACALDDLAGHRDGSDLANYGGDRRARPAAHKPLVTGELTEREAVVFARSALGCGAVLTAAALWAAPHRPWWAVAGLLGCAALSVQYSWGLRLSHRGLVEVTQAAVGWAVVLPPYGLLTASAPAGAVVQALLFGIGPLLFGVYSNTHDREGDRAIGRPTAATVLSRRANAAFVAGLSLLEAGVIAGAGAAGLVPWWCTLLLAPVVVLRAGQFHLGMRRHRVLAARRMGIRVHRCALVLLLTVNLFGGGVRG